MQFLAPLFLAGLAAIAIPIWVHLARQHRAPLVPFSAVRMIPAAPVEQRSMRRLRDLALLALRAAAIALLCLAFARPFLAQAAEPSPITVVAVDVSASMGGPRFDEARAAARAAIDEAPADHRVGVTAFDHHGRAVLLPQSDRGAARAAIDRLEPGFGATRYAAAIASAADVFDGAPGRIVVVTDRQLAGWAGDAAARVPPDVDVGWAFVEPPASNAGVTALGVRGGRLRATIVNSGREAIATTASLTARGDAASAATAIDSRAISIEPGETQIVEFAEALPSRGDLEVRVADEGGVPGDDARYLVVDPAPRLRVLIVTSGLDEHAEAFYVRHALEAAEAGAAPDITVAGGPALRERLTQALEDADVAIVLSTRGIERDGPNALASFRRRGGGVLLAAGPTAEPAVLAAMLDAGDTRAIAGAAESQSIVVADTRHPVFASLGPLAGALGSARVTRSMFLDAERSLVLARFTNGAPAIVERPRGDGEGRTLALTTDMANSWNDLALHPAFVPLVHEMTAHVDGRPGLAREYVIGAPGAPAERPGVSAAAGRDGWRAAVNVDPGESDSAVFLDDEARERVVVDERAEAQATAALIEREAAHPLWRYAIAVMLAVLLIEGLFGRRRAHVGAR